MNADERATNEQLQRAADALKLVIRGCRLSPDYKAMLEQDVEAILERYDIFSEAKI